MRLVLLRQIPEDENLRHQWNALLERAGDLQVFYTYEWALAVQRAYVDSLSPLLFLARDEQGALLGVAALAKSVSDDRVSFLCATTGDYCDFLSVPEDRHAFVAAVFSELKNLDVKNLTLTNLPGDSATFPAIQKLARHYSYHSFRRQAYACAQFSLQSLDRLQNGKPRVARPKMIRRSLNAMGRGGAMRIDHARSWSAVSELLPQFMQAHVARFLVTGRISNMAREERRVFLTELAKLLSAQDWLCLTRLMAGEKTIAWNYGFQFRGSWFWYQPTFDSDAEKHSPGYCLLAKIIEEAAENPDCKTVDLGLGAEEYKDRIANQDRRTLYITLRSSAAEHVYEIARYYVAKAVKASPKIERSIRVARAAVDALRKRVQLNGFGKTMGWAFQRSRTSVFIRDEVFFYELVSNPPLVESSALSLKRIDLDLLAAAAMQYGDDEGTLAYLLRCAGRLHVEDYTGFALLNADGHSVHFTWAGPFAGFHWAELNSTLPAPLPDSVILFDSWTPVSQRGRGYYAPTVALVAMRMQRQGRQAWGFSAATNTSSVRGLEKIGFPRRFSIVRHKVMWWQWLSRHNIVSATDSEALAA